MISAISLYSGVVQGSEITVASSLTTNYKLLHYLHCHITVEPDLIAIV